MDVIDGTQAQTEQQEQHETLVVSSIEPNIANHQSNTWRSCCLIVDKDMVRFFSQLTFIALVIIVCVYKLIRDLSCTAQIGYSNMLSLTLGVLIPSPRIRAEK